MSIEWLSLLLAVVAIYLGLMYLHMKITVHSILLYIGLKGYEYPSIQDIESGQKEIVLRFLKLK